jgi:hypothetical protein
LPWVARLASSREMLRLTYPLALSLLFCSVAQLLSRRSRIRYGESNLTGLAWAILSLPVSGILFWFFTAPDPRYAHALFWLLLLCSVIVLLSVLQVYLRGPLFLVAVAIVFILGNLHFVGYVVTDYRSILNISRSGWYPVPTVPMIERTTDSGLVVLTPGEGEAQSSDQDLSWDAPLPSTPYFNPRLRLRDPGTLARGFTVRD